MQVKKREIVSKLFPSRSLPLPFGLLLGQRPVITSSVWNAAESPRARRNRNFPLAQRPPGGGGELAFTLKRRDESLLIKFFMHRRPRARIDRVMKLRPRGVVSTSAPRRSVKLCTISRPVRLCRKKKLNEIEARSLKHTDKEHAPSPVTMKNFNQHNFVKKTSQRSARYLYFKGRNLHVDSHEFPLCIENDRHTTQRVRNWGAFLLSIGKIQTLKNYD